MSLDTEVFVRANFNYSSGALKRLREFVEAGSVSVILPSVTSREIERKIRENARVAGERLRGAKNKARILSTSSRFTALSDDSLESEFLTAFHEYRTAIDAQILEHEGLAFETLLRDYFALRPPFEAGRKQHEFLDAAAIEVLRQYAESRKQKAIFVSGDAGVAQACAERGLGSFDSLDKLFDEIAKVENSPESLRAAREVIESQHEWIDELIEDAFRKQASFELADEIGEADLIAINRIEELGLQIHTVHGHEIQFEMDVKIHFVVQASFEDHLAASVGLPGNVEEPLTREITAKVYGKAMRAKDDPETVDGLDIEELDLPRSVIGVRVYDDYDID